MDEKQRLRRTGRRVRFALEWLAFLLIIGAGVAIGFIGYSGRSYWVLPLATVVVAFCVPWLAAKRAALAAALAAFLAILPTAIRAFGFEPFGVGDWAALSAIVLGWSLLAVSAAWARARTRWTLIPVIPALVILLLQTYVPLAGQLSTVRRTSFYLPMRDGVRIAVDLYLPRGIEGSRIPAILQQTRYFRGSNLRWPASLILAGTAEGTGEKRKIVERGYAFVVVDARGSGASFGSRTQEWSMDEVRDGAQVIDWIVSQPWSSRRVGATGISYDGTAAEMLVRNLHPALKAIAPRFSLFDNYTDIAFPGGNHLSFFTERWGKANAMLDSNRVPAGLASWISAGVRPVDADRDGSLLRAAVAEHAKNYDVHALALRLTFRDDAGPGGMRLGDMSPHSWLSTLRQANIPVYGYAAWFDGAYQRTTISRFLAAPHPGSRLILGPWDHGGERNAGPHMPQQPFETVFGRQIDDLIAFFDHHLKGTANGVDRQKPIRYYVMGDEQWRSTDRWPPAARMTPFYLTARRGLDGVRPAAASHTRYRVDPSVGTGGKTRWDAYLAADVVYGNMAPIDARLLTYTSAALPAAMEVTGHPIIRLQVSSDATDGQFFVFLEDVMPDGRVVHITEGSLRALHRKISPASSPYPVFGPYHSFLRSDAQPLVPGQIAEIAFDLIPTSYVFKKGHRIRIAIAGADKDHFALLPGPPPTIAVHEGGAAASRIELPIIPR